MTPELTNTVYMIGGGILVWLVTWIMGKFQPQTPAPVQPVQSVQQVGVIDAAVDEIRQHVADAEKAKVKSRFIAAVAPDLKP